MPNWIETVAASSHPETATGIGYFPHWATCPKADKFRRRK